MANTISENTKLKVTIASAISIVVAVVSATVVVVNTFNAFSRKQDDALRTIMLVQKNCWQVGDQVQFASKLDKENAYLNVPDPLQIMRDRLVTERADSDRAKAETKQ